MMNWPWLTKQEFQVFINNDFAHLRTDVNDVKDTTCRIQTWVMATLVTIVMSIVAVLVTLLISKVI